MSKEFPNGVSYYSKGIAEVEIYFPEGREVCQYCPFCYSEDALERYRCRITPTYRIIPNPFAERAGFCPIVKIERKE
ncbi:MAG: hypothetical protein K2G22_02265 [Eubacterium sp.]|nr:hypothetical protein [Eubacterium sp.]